MKKFTILILVFFFIAGCVQFVPENETDKSKEQKEKTETQNFQITEQKNVLEFSNWHKITNGMELKEEIYKKESDNTEEKITIIKINPDMFDFKIMQDTENPKDINQWQKENKALFVCNAGYFQENYKTAGLLVIDGKAFGPKKSSAYDGMLLIKNGYPQLRYLPVSGYDYDKEKIDFGVQSFPVLIKPVGLDNLTEDDEQISRRTVIAQDEKNNFYFIFTHNFNISLYQLMKYLQNSNLNLKIALNLDGGSSTGLEINYNDFAYSIESVNSVPNVIVINKK